MSDSNRQRNSRFKSPASKAEPGKLPEICLRSRSTGRNQKNINDYRHLISTKVNAQPLLEFVSWLRTDQPPRKKSFSRNPEPFAFYQKDMEKWAEKTAKSLSPTKGVSKKLRPREKSPINVLDVDVKGNAGPFEDVINRGGNQHTINFVFQLRDYKKTAKFNPNEDFNFFKTCPSFHILGETPSPVKKVNLKRQSIPSLQSGNSPDQSYFSKKSKILCSPKVSTNIKERFMDKYTDRNIANFKQHFNPINGKFQIEWQCTLRSTIKKK